MANTEIVEYLRQQKAAGYSEATLREHLKKQGWSAAGIDTAFRDLKHAGRKPSRKKSQLLRRGGRQKQPNRKLRRLVKFIVIVAIVLVAAIIIDKVLTHKPVPKPKATPPLTNQQRQTLDVNTLGGAVGQYVIENNQTLPERVSPAPDGSSVVLCGKTCDPNTWQVSALQAYKPSDVRLVHYATGLAVPEASTMYIVSGATCKKGTLTDQGIRPLSMAILYATQNDSTLQQHCVAL